MIYFFVFCTYFYQLAFYFPHPFVLIAPLILELSFPLHRFPISISFFKDSSVYDRIGFDLGSQLGSRGTSVCRLTIEFESRFELRTN